MRRVRYIILAFVIPTALMLGLLPTSTAHAASTSSFDPTRIIDDGVFYDSNSMTVAQIQAFLNSKVPTCDTYGQQPSEYGGGTRAQYGTSVGDPPPYICLKNYYENPVTHANNLSGTIPPGAISAAQIIYTAATYYGINPQVLIVLIQKEQGLVTDTWPFPYEYTEATGYGCPDTAPCSSLYYGFYNQVNQAALQFQNYETYPNSFNYVPGPGNYVQYSPNASCGGTTLDIQNQATASLYDYTPYQPDAAALAAGYGTGDSCSSYGNRNFWLYFNAWFGSTLYAQPVGALLLDQASTGELYLVTTDNNTRYYVPNWPMMQNYGLDAYPAQSVPDATIDQYTDGGTLTNLVYNSNGVFLENNQTLYHVSPAMCTAWNLDCYDSSVVLALGTTFQTAYLSTAGELSPLLSYGGVIYEMVNGQMSPIANPSTLNTLGLGSTAVLVASAVNANQPLGPLLITTPGVIQLSPGSPLYYFDGTNYYQVPDMNSYSDWGLAGVTQLAAEASSYATAPPPSTMLTSFVSSNGTDYIIDQGRKLSVPASLGSPWQTSQFTSSTTMPSALFNSLPSATLTQNIYTTSGIYVLSGGEKHYVTSMDDLAGLNITAANTTNLNSDKLQSVPSGIDALPDGKLVLTANDNDVYVVNNHELTYIPNTSIFAAYGYSWGKIFSYPSESSLAPDYPVDTNVLGDMSDPNGNDYLVVGSSLYELPASLTSDFGINTTLSPISDLAIKQTSIPTLPRFMYNSDNGEVFYASGGAIHYVSGPASFAAYGGLHANMVTVNTQFINMFTLGQPI